MGDVHFDFDDVDSFDSHHYAFLVNDEDFDTIFARIQAAEIPFSADPLHKRVGELNDNEGGRGLYFHDPNGHNLELLTRA